MFRAGERPPQLHPDVALVDEATGFVALISHRYWRLRFGGDPDVVGKTVRMAERPYTVVGVMPPTFLFPDRDVDWWTPAFVDA